MAVSLRVARKKLQKINSSGNNTNVDDDTTVKMEVLALKYKVDQAKKREMEAKRCLKAEQQRLDDNLANIITQSHKIMSLKSKLRLTNELVTRNLEDLKTINSSLRRTRLIEDICTIEGDLKRAQTLTERGTRRILTVSKDIDNNVQRELDNTKLKIMEADKRASSLGEKLLHMKMNSRGSFIHNALESTYEGALNIITRVMTRLLEKRIARANSRAEEAKTREVVLEDEARKIREQTEIYRNGWSDLMRQQLEIKYKKTHLKICYVNFGTL